MYRYKSLDQSLQAYKYSFPKSSPRIFQQLNRYKFRSNFNHRFPFPKSLNHGRIKISFTNSTTDRLMASIIAPISHVKQQILLSRAVIDFKNTYRKRYIV